MKTLHPSRGFTLIELMVVVIIVGILAAVAVPLLTNLKHKAIASEAVVTLGTVETAAENYFIEHGEIASAYTDLTDAGIIGINDLSGTYFDADDYVAILSGFTFAARGLSAGSGTAKGITITKSADGLYTTSGVYDPSL